MFYFDPLYWVLLIPAILLSLYASLKVKTTFSKYSRVSTSSGMSGAQAARRILDMFGASEVRIEAISGRLSDNYDPRSKTLNLSEDVYGDSSLAAVGVAAHEAGHALQHAKGYAPLALRSGLVPIASIGSNLAPMLIILGFFMRGLGGLSSLMIQAGIVLFSAAVAFTLITLPVEFNASNRAMSLLTTSGVITSEEYKPVRKVLNAAAMTYVAAALAAIMQLIYYIMLSDRRR
ncbi:MAG: zinc metallopeptidase [Actinobacteria bacterium]|nr:zinc metallopeptidase [Actinomycetota bacterium]